MRRSLFCALLPLASIFGACADPEETPVDSGVVIDTGVPRDTGVVVDTGSSDSGVVDTGPDDTGVADTGDVPDSTPTDAMPPDLGPVDGGPPVIVEVAYRANAEELLLAELYLVKSSTSTSKVSPVLAGGPPLGKNGDGPAGVFDFGYNFDGTTLVYVAQQDTYDYTEIYAADVTASRAGPVRKVSLPTSDSQASILSIAPNTNWMAFDQVSAGGSNFESHFVDLRAQPPVHTHFNQGLVLTFDWAPNGTQFAFMDIIVSASDRDLWFYDVPSGTRERVNPGANLGLSGQPVWSPSGGTLVYAADEGGLRLFDLYAVSVTGTTLGTRERIHPALPSTADPFTQRGAIQFSPDGAHLAYSVDAITDTVNELIVVDLSLPFPQPLDVKSGPMAPGAMGIAQVSFNPTSDRLAYVASQDDPNSLDVYVTDLTFATLPVKVSPPFVGSGQVTDMVWAKGGQVLVFRANSFDANRLYAVDVTTMPPGPTIELSPALTGAETVGLYDLSPDGIDVVMRLESGTSTASLYTVSLATMPPTGPVKFADTVSSGVWCWSPDGNRLAFGANVRPEVNELYMIDRGLPAAVKISGPIIDGGFILGCEFPPR